MELYAAFRFHPIGQGCFYSGKIRVAESEFNLVYDCGSYSDKRHLTKAISNYHNSLSNGVIDLIIISHFHEDHVNGVISLLEKIKCKRLIIPYYFPIERLILFSSTNRPDTDYSDLLRDPISFFSNEDRFDIDEIIIIGKSEGDNQITLAETPPVKPFDSKKNNNGFACKMENISDDPTFSSRVIEKEKMFTKKEKQKFAILPCRFSLNADLWEFAFYLQDFDKKDAIKKFEEQIEDLLKLIPNANIFQLFYPTYLEVLKSFYRSNFGNNLNYTSLAVFHGPAFDISNQIGIKYLGNNELYSFHSHENKWGTLLTGDMSIKSTEMSRNLIKYFGENYLKRICFFQVPHHGSKYNWKIECDEELRQFCFYVVSHGIGKKHPHIEVVEDINENSIGKVFLNNEVQDFDYYLNISLS